MNREIKFRAWDTETHQMCNVLKIDFDQWYVVVMPYNQPDPTEDLTIGERHSFEKADTDRFILMQYTGLKDKNGKEIYEGDLIKCHEEVGTIDEKRISEWVAEVVYKIGSFVLVNKKCCNVCKDGNGYIINLNEAWFPVEVIGNIHDNPDLL